MSATLHLTWTNDTDASEPSGSEVADGRDYTSFVEAIRAFDRVCRYPDTITCSLSTSGHTEGDIILKEYHRP